MSDAAAVVTSKANGVGVITLNRPERLNAMDEAMTWVLVDALRSADEEEDTSVVILQGSGRVFCAGGDVSNMGRRSGPARVLHRDVSLHGAFSRLRKPIIAMVQGAAIGLGLTIALRCDLVVAATDAKLGDPHVQLGLVAGDGAVASLARGVGPLRTKELLLLPTNLTGAEAAARAVVARAVPAAELEEKTFALALDIAKSPAAGLRFTKQLLARVDDLMMHDLLEPALGEERVSMGLPAHREAVARFQERRATR